MNCSSDSVDIFTSKNHCNTKINVEKFDFMWTIENFSLCREEIGQSLNSCPIKFEKCGNLEWCLKIYPKGESEESKDFVGLYLKLNESDKSEVMAKFRFYILNEIGKKKTNLGTIEYHKFTKEYELGWPEFVKRDILLNKKNEMLPNDKLTVFCEIYMICDTVNTVAYSSTVDVDKPLPKITKDIGNMLNMSMLSDCIIKVGKTAIKVHKFMLASRSEIFYAMFNNKCLESQSHEIEIKDFRLEVVEEMINYIYTDDSPNLKKIANEILAIAEKYNLQGLKALAEKTLSDSLNIRNVCEYLEISEIYSAKLLKEKCIDFICMNTPKVVNTKDWNESVLRNPLLVGQIINNLVEEKKKRCK